MSKLPSELSEQITVARWLKRHGILFFHPANGGKRMKREAMMLKASGVVAGVPDLIILDPPPVGGYVATAIEMKKQKGASPTKVQREWLKALESRQWATSVCKGADAAIKWLRELGYGV